MVRSLLIATALFLGVAAPALAHHSFAMFDTTKMVTVTGTVKEFQWSNPHAVLLVVTEAPDTGAADLWTLELTSPGNLTRSGWTRHSLNPGDKVEVQFNPLRDGTHGGGFNQVKLLSTGQVLTSTLQDLSKPGVP